MQAEARVSAQLETALVEERAQAARDREELLSQITSLVNKSGERQDARWQSKVDEMRSDMTSCRSTFEDEEKKYSEAMGVWSQKESLLIEEVLKSRDMLKSRMKKDWTVSSCTLLPEPMADEISPRLSTSGTMRSKQRPGPCMKRRFVSWMPKSKTWRRKCKRSMTL